MVDAIGQIENALQERGAGRKRNARIAGEFRRYRYVRRFETELAGGERLRIGRSEESLKDLFTGRALGEIEPSGRIDLHAALGGDPQRRVRLLKAEPSDVVSEIVEANGLHSGRGHYV